MSKERNDSEAKYSYRETVFFGIIIFVLIVLTAGEPDLLDAIVSRVQCAKPEFIKP